jgi:TetR/AcrR family transcriptional regulator, tetracycline repressor protein
MLVMSEAGYNPALPPDQRAEQQRQAQIRLSMLRPERLPCLVESAGPMTAHDDPEFHYQFGIDLFVAGVEGVARRMQAQ